MSSNADHSQTMNEPANEQAKHTKKKRSSNSTKYRGTPFYIVYDATTQPQCSVFSAHANSQNVQSGK